MGPRESPKLEGWCRRSESNRYEGLPRRILNPLRLPVPPLRLEVAQSTQLRSEVIGFYSDERSVDCAVGLSSGPTARTRTAASSTYSVRCASPPDRYGVRVKAD